jgi:GntR family transcriptional regulator/MocR family aminotransferase
MPSLIPLSKSGGPLFRQIYLGLRKAILSGAFRAGQRLPSTRALADELGVSRTVVLLAYEQLLAEGYVSGRGGSGTYVSDQVAATAPARREESAEVRLTHFGAAAVSSYPIIHPVPQRAPALQYDFAYGRSDVEVFPFEMWRRILLRNARSAPVRTFDYGPAGGSNALREAIAAHLRRSRAVVCDASQVIVVNGSQQALDLVVRALVERGDSVAIEDPHYLGAREILRAAGARLRPIPVDRDGLDPGKLPKHARLAMVTPSHQFPTGAILSLARRLALLEWARHQNAVIVEDDYDGEFRYDDQPLESLQGLDTEGRVIYIGTFSRTIFPALRIGYLVAPKSLVPALQAAKWLCDRHTATLEQETLAEFIATGVYERHLRRVRRRNTARRKALLGAIANHLHPIEVTGDGAGAHVVLWPSRRLSEEAAIARAASRNVRIYGIARYFLSQPSRPGFLLGYTRLSEHQIREGIRRLAEIL